MLDISGCGPTRTPNGELKKPDLVAPGWGVPSPLGWDRRRAPPGSEYDDDNWGTSFAVPHVAGLVALLFEMYGPNLARREICALLLGAPATNACLPELHSNIYGWGRARAPAPIFKTFSDAAPASAGARATC